MAMSHPPPPPLLCDLEVSITSARDLKNVNWKHGDLCAYAVAWVDEENKVATRVDASGDTNPSWVKQKFSLPVRKPISECRLSIEIYHDKAANPEKALVGSVSIPLPEIVDAGGCDETLDYSLKLKRPSGRPQGKVDFSVRVRERRYVSPPPPPAPGSSIYTSTTSSSSSSTSQQPISPRDGIPTYTYPPSNYPYVPTPNNILPAAQPYNIGQPYPGYNTQPYAAPAPYPTYNTSPPPPAQPYAYVQRPSPSSYGSATAPGQMLGYPQEALPPKKGGPLTSSTSPFGGGMGTGLAIGALAGAVGGLALDEFVHHEEKEAAERQADEDAARYAELDAARDDYGGDDYSYDDDF